MKTQQNENQNTGLSFQSDEQRGPKHHATQFLLRLDQTITVERGHSLICIPDRTTADYELSKLRSKHGASLIKAVIRKDKPGPRSTYTLRYFTRDTETHRLF
jgi:hypothetical protein